MPARKAARTKKEAGLDHVQSVQAPENKESPHDFLVVGIGASAGGLEALTDFLGKVPADIGMAFVLIQHLAPSQPSRLTELLGRVSSIPVHEVAENTRVEPDNVYVIPPGKDMIIRDRTLWLQLQPVRPSLAHGIDIFFHSLAEDVGEQAVAIILSGTASDGTDGAKAVKARHGLVIVQDPESAKYDGMPRAAIDAGVADYVLKPEVMADQLIKYQRKSSRQREATREAMEKDDTSLRNILSLVRARTGRDFSGYKVSSITRRIERRMSVNRIETSEEYLRFLQEHPSEIEELMKDFLINVTAFFRDREAFVALKKEIGKILSAKPEGSSVRAWIPGCSTGEEAYSLAMLLVENAEESKRRYDLQIFGTDLDTDTITFARAGLYPETIAPDVGEERLEQFFTRSGASYHVKKNIREKLIFAVHDLVSDPPYSRMDIVSVRNLLIYFDTDLQKKIIPRLHYSLNEGGLLFLGTAETIGETPDLFTTVDSKWRIYRPVHKQGAPHAIFTGQPALGEITDASALPLPVAKPPAGPTSEQILLEALPPSIIVNRDYKVIYTHGNTGKYLHLPEGNPSSDLLGMIDTDLRLALTTALHEASQEQKEVCREGLRVKHNGETQSVKLKVRPLSKLAGSMIVTFEDLHRPRRRKVKGETLTEAQRREMEQELQTTRETLRGTIEELETANEELRSANEEYMSTNEELRSANEELETSREELRSVNEELTTVNTEREKKIEELTDVSDDMRNLLNSTAIATIFLDEKLRIRRFTPAATTLFNFISTDVGRPVEDISSRLKADGMSVVARRVLETLVPVEQDVQTEDGRWYSMRVHPYRTSDNSIEGVVASFIDINQVKAAFSYAQGIVDTVREPLLVLNEKLKVISASRAFYQTFGVTRKNTEGQFLYELGDHQWDIPKLKELLENILKEDRVFEGYQVEHDFPGVGHRLMLLNARRFYDGAGATQSILLAMEDATSRPGLETYTEGKDVRKRKS
ncbi:MAG: chemotaxis protein CheB [Dehalococcoidales bacterium]|nr:chemotaxis protein CheB [Dehalococcoidales bacterium]